MPEFESLLTFHKALGVERSGELLVVRPLGDAFGFRVNDVQTEYNRIYSLLDDPELKHLIVDCTGVEFIDSTITGVLVNLAQKIRSGNGRVLLCELSERVTEILGNSKLIATTGLWDVVDTRDAAVAALAGADA